MRPDVRCPMILAAAACALATGALAAGEAKAQATITFDVPAQPMSRAALQLGAQAGVSIETSAATACGRSRPVRGAHRVEAAFAIMLRGSGCGVRRIDSRTFVIVRERPAPPAPPPTVRPPEPTPISTLDEVVVTATKRDLELGDAPYAISALDGASFDASARRDTAALSTRLAGLTVTNLGPGRNKLFVRGLADSALTGQTQAMVGLYLDDTRLTYNAPDPDLRLVDLERVELLRGPQATLYGAGAMGGVLKLVSRSPVIDLFEADVSGGLTFAADTSPGYSTDLMVNLPLVRERLALRAVLYGEVLEGVIDDPGLGLTNTGKTRRHGSRVSLLWRLDPDWEVRIASINQNLAINDTQYAFASGSPYDRSLSQSEPSNNDFSAITVSVTGDRPWGRVKLSGAAQIHDLDRRYDATRAAASLGGSGAPIAYDEADSIRAIALEASLATPTDRAVSGLIGLYVSQYSHARTGDIREAGSDEALFSAIKDDSTRDLGLFAEASWAPGDRLTLTLGGRYFEVLTESSTVQTIRGAGLFEGRNADDGFAAKAVAEYDLSDTLLLYAQISEGYRVGGFNGGALLDQGYGQPGAGGQPFRAYRPDRLISWEAGLRWRLFEDRLSLRLAGFGVDWRSIQSDRVSEDGLPFTANIGDGNSGGLEVEGVWREGPWRFDFNLMGNTAQLEAGDADYPLAIDTDLPGVPSLLGAMTLRRDAHVLGRRSWVSASVGYVGQSVQQLSPTVQSEMGDYVTSELAAAVEFGDWSAVARLDNLFGANGDTFGYGNPFLVGRETVNTPQRPRNLSLSLSRRF
ncbi:TonB-dependent receptor domain-containing protein [Brevundimonas sp. GCM10030266]|uniref:TonB-dependent receptor domain-containing protein n=1 Tax=Brevundimonas sp. GCM10030266 TaxID=3273386 RepID=UPI003611599E